MKSIVVNETTVRYSTGCRISTVAWDLYQFFTKYSNNNFTYVVYRTSDHKVVGKQNDLLVETMLAAMGVWSDPGYTIEIIAEPLNNNS